LRFRRVSSRQHQPRAPGRGPLCARRAAQQRAGCHPGERGPHHGRRQDAQLYLVRHRASRGAPAQCSPEAGEGSLLSADGGSGGAAQEKGHTAVVLKAMGRAINKTVTIGAARPRHPLSGAHRRAAPALCVGMCRMARGAACSGADLRAARSGAAQLRSSSGASSDCTRTPRLGRWT